ncbi:hypothetical protein Avbf_17103 [Armadillidium vulgare]|nr:hypothetical protein Avbf_17103 [Armadillidium vulgare]
MQNNWKEIKVHNVHKQDLMLNPFFGTSDRNKYFDLSSYVFISPTGALLGHPTSWIAVGCAFILGLVMTVISRIITKCYKEKIKAIFP